MLFDDVVTRQRGALMAFFDDPIRSTLILRVDPDLEFVAARFVACLGNDEAPQVSGREVPIVFGATASFDDPAAYYCEAAAQIHPSIEVVRESYGPEDPDLVLPGPPELRGRPGTDAGPEEAFAAYLESIARGLGNWHDTVVFVLRFEAGDARMIAASLTSLGGCLMTPGLKLVVLDERREPRLPALRSRRTRGTSRAFDPARSDATGRLARFLAHGRERVLGLHLRAHQVDTLRRELADMPRHGVVLRQHWIEAAFEGRTAFAAAVYRAVRDGRGTEPTWLSPTNATLLAPTTAEQRADGGGLPERLHDARAIDRPEQSLVELIERAAARDGDGGLCVVLRPTSVHDVAQWHAFVHSLSRACVRPDVKFIALDVGGSAPLPDTPALELPWGEHVFTLESERIHASLEAILRRPDLTPEVRVAHLFMLANVRVGQGRLLDGAEHAAEGIVLAEGNSLRAALATGWWTLGYALQRAGEHARARNAFAEATDAALAEGNFVAAANALMGIGHTHYLERSWASALEAYELAREHWLDAGHVFGECQALVWGGEACRKAGQHRVAQERFRLAQARFLAMRAPFEAMAEGGLADLYERMAANAADDGARSTADSYRRLAQLHGSHGPACDCPA